jgi:hypothetical protein
MSSRVAVLIGNSRSAGARELQDLHGPTHDVQDLAPVLRDPELGGFDVYAVIDATTSETIDAIEEGLRQAGREGLFLLYFSCWGVVDANGRLYLATGDTRLRSLPTTAISTKFLRHLLEYSVCEQAVVILDCCFTGAEAAQILTMNVSDELRHVRAKGGATVAVLASSPRVQSPEDRESDQGGRTVGTLTHLLVDGLRSGAADGDEDGEVTVAKLGEFLGLGMPRLCPTWLADAASDAIVVAASPQRRPVSIEAGERAVPAQARWAGRRIRAWILVLAGVAAVIAAASMWGVATGRGSPPSAAEIQRGDLASLDLETAGLVREQLLARQLAANAGWVEHRVDSWQELEGYSGAVLVDPLPGVVDATGRIQLPYRGEMDLNLSGGTHGIGILCRRRMNVASAWVRLSNGEELRFEIATHLPADVFYSFLSPVPIEGVRLEGKRGSLEIERLLFYVDPK